MAINTLFIGQNRVELPSIDSTNNYALELIKNAVIADGTLVWAHEQTQGRGQRGNEWLSNAHQNLTLSLLLQPGLTAEKQFYITKVASLAVAEMVSGLIGDKAEVKIKWPNDIYAGDKKIAGILIENILRGDQISNSIIGIGLNVNQNEFGEGLSKAISLQLLTGKTFDIKNCIEKLCEYMEPRYLQLKANKLDLLNKDYYQYLYRLDQLCDYEKNNLSFRATLTGVNEQGKLLLKLESGELMECNFKEVTFL
jgi:BirA family biotin operon repressor/biotin-[acetyl-CoA-carboxylase] ligase